MKISAALRIIFSIPLYMFPMELLASDTAQSPNDQLIKSIKNGDVNKIEDLLIAGADANYKYISTGNKASSSSSPLQIAISQQNLRGRELKTRLQRCGVDTYTSDWEKRLSQQCRRIASNIKTIIKKNMLAIKAIELLIAFGADVNIKYLGSGTPLHKTISAEVIRLLLNAGADPNASNSTKRTPLHLHRDADAISLLLDAGADPNAEDWTQNTPLHGGQDIKSLKLLIDAGANPNTKNRDGITPLHMAVNSNNINTARYLLSAGANPNAQSQHGTPLNSFSISNSENIELMQLLLSYGADPNLKSERGGKTPLITAIERNQLHYVRHLIENGVDVDSSKYAFNALHKLKIMHRLSDGDDRNKLEELELLLINNSSDTYRIYTFYIQKYYRKYNVTIMFSLIFVMSILITYTRGRTAKDNATNKYAIIAPLIFASLFSIAFLLSSVSLKIDINTLTYMLSMGAVIFMQILAYPWVTGTDVISLKLLAIAALLNTLILYWLMIILIKSVKKYNQQGDSNNKNQGDQTP